MIDTGEFITLGRYKLEAQPFAEGGMGRVYRAYDPDLDRTVAVKIIHEQFSSNEKYRKRFRREAKILAKIGQVNGIVTVFDVGSKEPLWLAMELLDGVTFSEKKNLEIESVIGLAKKLALSLKYAHESGIVHCDIKPDNIFCQRGQPVLIDWGLGFSEDAEEGTLMAMTTVRGAHGTPAYTAPEQTLGYPSFSSDVYSLAASLFEVMTGQIPFLAKTVVAVANLHANAPRPSLVTLRPDCPFWFDALIRQMMSIKEEDRPTLGQVLDIIKSRETLTSSNHKLPSVAIHPSIDLDHDTRLHLLNTAVIHYWNSKKTYDFILVDSSKINEINTNPRKSILVSIDSYSCYDKIAEVAKFTKAEMLFNLSFENILEKMSL